MGQYFNLINEDKKEYVCVYCVGGLAKWYEWVLNRQFKLLGLLIRRSDESGGGDMKLEQSDFNVIGRWAGDRISLVGDYDSSGLYDTAYESYKNISEELLEAWNTEMQNDGSFDEMINFTPCNDCPSSDKHKKMIKRLKIKGEYKFILWDLQRKLDKAYITEKDFKNRDKPVENNNKSDKKDMTLRPDFVINVNP